MSQQQFLGNVQIGGNLQVGGLVLAGANETGVVTNLTVSQALLVGGTVTAPLFVTQTYLTPSIEIVESTHTPFNISLNNALPAQYALTSYDNSGFYSAGFVFCAGLNASFLGGVPISNVAAASVGFTLTVSGDGELYGSSGDTFGVYSNIVTNITRLG
jgi:hypothetical protein